MYHILFIHELIKGHIDYFQVMVIMNKEAVNICLQVLFCDFDNIVTYATIMNVIKRCRYRYLCEYIYIYSYLSLYQHVVWNLLSPVFMPDFLMSFKTFCAQSLNHVWIFRSSDCSPLGFSMLIAISNSRFKTFLFSLSHFSHKPNFYDPHEL